MPTAPGDVIIVPAADHNGVEHKARLKAALTECGHGDAIASYEGGLELTRRRLAAWGLHFHELYLGKPSCDILVDNRAVFFRADWIAIEAELTERT